MRVMQQQLQEQNHQIAGLVSALKEQKCSTSTAANPSSPAPRIDTYGDLIRDLPSFNYDADEDATFDARFKRYGAVIDDRGTELSSERKRNLIIEKLDKAAYKTYSEHVLPLKPQDIDLATTIENLTKLFGPKNRHSFDDASS